MSESKKYSEKKLLTVKEMCDYMSIGETYARELLSSPNCPFVYRMGRRIYANRTFLDKWIDSDTGRRSAINNGTI